MPTIPCRRAFLLAGDVSPEPGLRASTKFPAALLLDEKSALLKARTREAS
jgi:hypothetical protein